MEPELTLTYDLSKSAEVTVTMTFAADAQLLDPEKAHLDNCVVQNHLLTQAAAVCGKYAELVMACQGKAAKEVLDKVRSEKAEKIAAVEAEYAAKEALAEKAAAIATMELKR